MPTMKSKDSDLFFMSDLLCVSGKKTLETKLNNDLRVQDLVHTVRSLAQVKSCIHSKVHWLWIAFLYPWVWCSWRCILDLSWSIRKTRQKKQIKMKTLSSCWKSSINKYWEQNMHPDCCVFSEPDCPHMFNPKGQSLPFNTETTIIWKKWQHVSFYILQSAGSKRKTFLFCIHFLIV